MAVTIVLHRHFQKGLISFDLPEKMYQPQIINLLTTCRDKHNDYVCVTLATPRKPRTTGPGSQNNHVWGHATQIATETGNEVDDVMDAAKERALKRGYPYHVNKITGKIKPYGTEELDTVQCGMLIDELHMIAGEMGITLIEAE
jgi:hypothetical protein